MDDVLTKIAACNLDDHYVMDLIIVAKHRARTKALPYVEQVESLEEALTLVDIAPDDAQRITRNIDAGTKRAWLIALRGF